MARLDRTGYPRGPTEAQLTLDTRILAVCDVYDALISKRVYREAWSHEQAKPLPSPPPAGPRYVPASGPPPRRTGYRLL